jgi:hypothetical protein
MTARTTAKQLKGLGDVGILQDGIQDVGILEHKMCLGGQKKRSLSGTGSLLGLEAVGAAPELQLVLQDSHQRGSSSRFSH